MQIFGMTWLWKNVISTNRVTKCDEHDNVEMKLKNIKIKWTRHRDLFTKFMGQTISYHTEVLTWLGQSQRLKTLVSASYPRYSSRRNHLFLWNVLDCGENLENYRLKCHLHYFIQLNISNQPWYKYRDFLTFCFQSLSWWWRNLMYHVYVSLITLQCLYIFFKKGKIEHVSRWTMGPIAVFSWCPP